MTLADSIISDVRTSNIDEEKHLRIISLRSYNKFNYQANSLPANHSKPYHHPPGYKIITQNDTDWLDNIHRDSYKGHKCSYDIGIWGKKSNLFSGNGSIPKLKEEASE